MPVDEDGGAYQPTPRMVEALKGSRVIAVACGEVHSLAVTQEESAGGLVYSWGCASYGRLGIENIKELTFDEDNEHFQHTPTIVESLREVSYKYAIPESCIRALHHHHVKLLSELTA